MQHPHPGLLEQVLGDLALAGKEQQVAQQPVLVELDQVVKQLGVLTLQAAAIAAFSRWLCSACFRRDGDRRATHSQ